MPSTFSRSTPAELPFTSWTLAHTWSDKGDNDIDLSDILALVADVYMFIKLDPAWPQQPRFFRALPELITAVAELLTKHQPHNAPALHSARTVQQVTHADFTCWKAVGLNLQPQRQRLGLRSQTPSVSLGTTTATAAATSRHSRSAASGPC